MEEKHQMGDSRAKRNKDGRGWRKLKRIEMAILKSLANFFEIHERWRSSFKFRYLNRPLICFIELSRKVQKVWNLQNINLVLNISVKDKFWWDNNYLFLLQVTAAYFLIQNWLFYEICSSPVETNHLPERQTIKDQALADIVDYSEIADASLFNTSTTFPPQKHDIGNNSYSKRLIKRHLKHPRPCELKTKIKWNQCLGRRFTKIHCRKHSVACLSPENLPPKCKTHIKAIPGKNGTHHSRPQSSPFLLVTWSAKRRALVPATTGCQKFSDIR